MKKNTDRVYISICKAILEVGGCFPAKISCIGKKGSLAEGFNCPLNKGDEYDCSKTSSSTEAAQKFLDNHKAFDIHQKITSIEEKNPHEEILQETPTYSSVAEAFEKGALKTGWFWDDDPNISYEGVLVEFTHGCGYLCIGVDKSCGEKVLGDISYHKNYSETKPKEDPWVEISVEQGLKLLKESAFGGVECRIPKGKGWANACIKAVSGDRFLIDAEMPWGSTLLHYSICQVRSSLLETIEDNI